MMSLVTEQPSTKLNEQQSKLMGFFLFSVGILFLFEAVWFAE